MQISRVDVIEKIEAFLCGRLSAEDLGWWAFDLTVESDVNFEAGFERLLTDVIAALQYFHDDDPMMSQFYPEAEEMVYYLRCLKGEEMYNPKRVPHWKV